MTAFKERTLGFLQAEWATYVERFTRWPAEAGAQRVRDQGYERFRDMLAHILAWWDEGMSIIRATAEGREVERRKYDFDVFNAAAVAQYAGWDESEFLGRFEQTRRRAAEDLGRLGAEAWENRRVRAWIQAVFIHHAREHLVALSPFLALDTLENEWGTYLEDYHRLQDKPAFLKKQGFESLRDLLAHVIGWWEQGLEAVDDFAAGRGILREEPDTDAYNRELIERYRGWPEARVLEKFEETRRSLIDRVAGLPAEAFRDPHLERWLAADVVEHYDDHAPDE